MRASSTKQQPRMGLAQGGRELKQQDYVDTRTLYQRLAEHQPREYQTSQIDKYRTPNKKLYENPRPAEKFSPVRLKAESPDRDKQKYSDLLQSSQKELFQAKSSLSDQQARFEKMIKDQKLRINELEMENLKLTKELSSFKNSLKKDLDTIHEKDSRIITEYQKRIKDSEEQNKHHIHETIKIKQNYEKEIQHLRSLLKDSDNKLEIYKREFTTFHSKARKDNDELTFKEDFIKRLQDSVKEKSKTIADLKNSNEQFLKMLEEKDLKVNSLEKDLRKEREQIKLLGERLSEVIYEKSPEKSSRGRSLAPEQKYQSAKFLKPEQESHDFEGSLEKSLKKARISLIKPEGEEGLLRLKNQVIDLELKINNLTAENLQLKRHNINLDEKCQSLEDDVKSYRSLISRSSKDSMPRYRNEREENKTELQSKLSQVLKEKEKLEKFYKDLVNEFDGNKKKLVEFEQKNKVINGREQEIIGGLNQLSEENDGLKKRLENEIKYSAKISGFVGELCRKLGLKADQTDLSALGKEVDGKVDEISQIKTKIGMLFRENDSLSQNVQKLAEEVLGLSGENEVLKEKTGEGSEIMKAFEQVGLEINKTKENLQILTRHKDLKHKFLDLVEINNEILQLKAKATKTDDLKAEIENYNEQLQEISSINLQLSQKLNKRTEELKESHENIDNLTKMLQETEKLNENLRKELETAEFSNLENSFKSLELESQHLKSELKRLELQNQSLTLEIKEKAQQVAIKEEQLSQNLKELYEICKESQLKDEIIKKSEQTIQDLNLESQSLQSENENLLKNLHQSTQENSKILENLEQVSSLKQEQDSTIKSLQQNLTQLSSEGKALQEANSALLGQVSKLQNENLSLANSLKTQPEPEILIDPAQLSELESQISSLAQRGHELQLENENLSKANSALNQELSELKSLAESKEQIKEEQVLSLKREKSDLSHFIESLEIRNRVQLKDISKLESTLEVKQSELMGQVAALQGQLAEVSSANDRLNENIAKLDSENLELKEKLDSALTRISDINSSEAMLENFYKSQLETQRLDHEGEIEDLQKQHAKELMMIQTLDEDQIEIYINPGNLNSIESLQTALQASKALIDQTSQDKENLEAQLSQTLAESLQLKNEVKDLIEKLETGKVENLRLSERIKELENENQDLNKLVDDENMQSIEDSLVGNDSIKLEIEGKDAEIKVLKDEINAVNKELDMVKSVLNERLIECEKNLELKQNLSKVLADCKEKEAKIKLLEMQKKKLLAENEDLKNDVKCLKEDNFALHQSGEISAGCRDEDEIEELKQRIDELEWDLKEKKEVVEDLSGKVRIMEEIREENESFRKNESELLNEISNLKHQLSSNQSELTHLNQELLSSQQSLNSLSQAHTSLTEENQKLQSQTSSLLTDLSQKSSQIDSLQVQLSNPSPSPELSTQIHNLQTQIKTLTEELKEKENKLKFSEVLKKKLQNENQEIEEDLKVIRNENFELARKIEEAEIKIEENHQRINEIEDNESVLENEIRKHKKIEEELKAENYELVKNIERLNKEIEQFNANNSKPDFEALAKLEKNVSGLNQELQSKQGKVLALEAEKRRILKDVEEMENDLKELRNQNFELHRKAEFGQQDFEVEQLRLVNLKLEENEISLKTKLNDYKSKEKDLRENLRDMEGKLNDLSSALDLKDGKVQSQEAEIQGLNQRIKEIIEEMDQLKNQLNEKNEIKQDKERLSKNEESVVNVQELESNLLGLKKQVAELEKNLKLKEIKIKALDGEKRKCEEDMKDIEILMQQIRAENFDLHRRLNEKGNEEDD